MAAVAIVLAGLAVPGDMCANRIRLDDVAGTLFPFLFRTTAGCNYEMSAISTLRNVLSAQAQFRSDDHADEDGDGVGEFGCFGEMSGAKPIRGTGVLLNPPVLSSAFRAVKRDGSVSRSGYRFKIYLPAPRGVGARESARAGMPPGVLDPDRAETSFVCYAWPEDYPQRGGRTFVVTEEGDIWATDSAQYSGDAAPLPGAAFDAIGLHRVAGDVGKARGQDGNVWSPVW